MFYIVVKQRKWKMAHAKRILPVCFFKSLVQAKIACAIPEIMSGIIWNTLGRRSNQNFSGKDSIKIIKMSKSYHEQFILGFKLCCFQFSSEWSSQVRLAGPEVLTPISYSLADRSRCVMWEKETQISPKVGIETPGPICVCFSAQFSSIGEPWVHRKQCTKVRHSGY